MIQMTNISIGCLAGIAGMYGARHSSTMQLYIPLDVFGRDVVVVWGKDATSGGGGAVNNSGMKCEVESE